MVSHASHGDDDEDTEDESSSVNSSEEENDPWNTLINDAVSKAWDAFAQIPPAFQKELGDVHMDILTWMTVIWKFSKASLKLLGK